MLYLYQQFYYILLLIKQYYICIFQQSTASTNCLCTSPLSLSLYSLNSFHPRSSLNALISTLGSPAAQQLPFTVLFTVLLFFFENNHRIALSNRSFRLLSIFENSSALVRSTFISLARATHTLSPDEQRSSRLLILF